MVNNISSKPNHVCVVIAIVCHLRHGTQALDSTASSLSANSECSLEDDHFLYGLQPPALQDKFRTGCFRQTSSALFF